MAGGGHGGGGGGDGSWKAYVVAVVAIGILFWFAKEGVTKHFPGVDGAQPEKLTLAELHEKYPRAAELEPGPDWQPGNTAGTTTPDAE